MKNAPTVRWVTDADSPVNAAESTNSAPVSATTRCRDVRVNRYPVGSRGAALPSQAALATIPSEAAETSNSAATG